MDIVHDTDAHQFRVALEGYRGELDYTLRDGVMIITHTEVPPAIGGRGIAAELTRTALATARGEGWKVLPACSYAAAFIRRHPEFSDLLA
ncbi:MAG TPA: GNAT family N-acetyltransferase [Rhodanobacteraceae bacterium]|nr:GNAT family N-acetyltransferase [Rhodanobacteraceae bacterium]